MIAALIPGKRSFTFGVRFSGDVLEDEASKESSVTPHKYCVVDVLSNKDCVRYINVFERLGRSNECPRMKDPNEHSCSR